MEHTTDRLFWTLTSIIIGALVLTISINAFPKMTQNVISPISGVIQQADKVGKTANQSGNQAAKDAANYHLSGDDTPTASTTNSQTNHASTNNTPVDDLGFTVVNNGDGTGTITKYNPARGLNVNIPEYYTKDGVKLHIVEIAPDAFYKAGIDSVTIPNSVMAIGHNSFYGNNLTSLSLPNNITSIADSAFSTNKLTNITLPSSLVTIGPNAFSWNQLTHVTLPTNVQTINTWAFWGNQINSINIPNSMVTIQKWAFQNNKLSSVNVPNSVSNLDAHAFDDNTTVNRTN